MDKIAVKYKPTPQCQVSRSMAFVDVDDEEALLAPPPLDPTPIQPMDPSWAFLKRVPFNREIEWNYTKFLVGRDGQVRAPCVERWHAGKRKMERACRMQRHAVGAGEAPQGQPAYAPQVQRP